MRHCYELVCLRVSRETTKTVSLEIHDIEFTSLPDAVRACIMEDDAVMVRRSGYLRPEEFKILSPQGHLVSERPDAQFHQFMKINYSDYVY